MIYFPTMFSHRTNWDLTPNRLSVAVKKFREAGRNLIDLTESNPTRCGLGGGGPELLKELSRPEVLRYDPAPCGPPSVRRAIAADYRRRGSEVREDRIVLTASTSESYSFLFRLLADAGDRVLVPTPSYPLLPFLIRLDHLQLATYPLVSEEGFRIDLETLSTTIDPRTRAVLTVHPGNPTGSFLKRDEADRLCEICRRHDIPLISDEVFSDYGYRNDPARLPSLADREDILTFSMNGLSKSLGLPQLKVGWIVVSGPPDRRREALARLEVIADTFLSVNTPALAALPSLLAGKTEISGRILSQVLANRSHLEAILPREGAARCLPSEGGWYAILEIPRTLTEEEWCLRLLEDRGLLVHPGYFYEFPHPGYLVVSLLPSPDCFQSGAGILAEAFTTRGLADS